MIPHGSHMGPVYGPQMQAMGASEVAAPKSHESRRLDDLEREVKKLREFKALVHDTLEKLRLIALLDTE